jgi:hypothetical protein
VPVTERSPALGEPPLRHHDGLTVTSRRAIIGFGVIVVSLVLATAQLSSAATLGGVSSEQLGAWDLPGGTGAPTVAAWDDFTRPAEVDLDGQASGGGGPAWSVVSGTWTNGADQTSASQQSADTASAAIVVDCGNPDLTVTAVLTGPTADATGLVVKRVGSSLLVVQHRDQADGTLEIARIIDGTTTVMATATNVGWVSPGTLSATYDGGEMTVRLDGTTRLTSTLTPADASTFGPSTTAGLVAGNDQQTLFDDFRCEHP